MNRTELEQKTHNVVAKQLGVVLEEVTQESILSDDLGADSLDVVELVMSLEEEFEIDIPDSLFEEHGDNITVKQLTDIVQSQIS